jgi:hypothetical protein
LEIRKTLHARSVFVALGVSAAFRLWLLFVSLRAHASTGCSVQKHKRPNFGVKSFQLTQIKFFIFDFLRMSFSKKRNILKAANF